MAADLSIHILEGATQGDVADMHSNTLGSRFFSPRLGGPPMDVYKKVGGTPQIWVGEVSWLKASLFEDGAETYVPTTVQRVSDLIGEHFPVIDDALIAKIAAAFEAENKTDYIVAEAKDVVAFLEKHKGKQAFTVSW